MFEDNKENENKDVNSGSEADVRTDAINKIHEAIEEIKTSNLSFRDEFNVLKEKIDVGNEENSGGEEIDDDSSKKELSPEETFQKENIKELILSQRNTQIEKATNELVNNGVIENSDSAKKQVFDIFVRKVGDKLISNDKASEIITYIKGLNYKSGVEQSVPKDGTDQGLKQTNTPTENNNRDPRIPADFNEEEAEKRFKKIKEIQDKGV